MVPDEMKTTRGSTDPDDLAEARRAPFILWAVLLLLGVTAEGLLIANRATWHGPSDAIGVGTVFSLTYGLAAALILSRRPRNAIGRLFFYVTTVMVLAQLSGEYAVYAYVTAPSELPLREVAAWVSQWTFFLAFPFGLTMLFLLFPDGFDTRRRWRVVTALAIIGGVGLTLLFMTQAGSINPAVRGSRALVFGSLAAFISAVYVGVAVGIGSLVGSTGKPNLGLSILATAIVVVGFQPVRERLQIWTAPVTW